MAILNAFSGVATIFLLVAIGFILIRSGKLSHEAMTALPRFITTIALPPFLLRTATTTLSKEQLSVLFTETRIPFFSIFIAFFIAFLLAHILQTKWERKGMFQAGFATSNAMAIGLPINLALFGEAGLPYALMYFVANATSFWTIGCYMISRSGRAPNASILSLETVKRVLSPPVVGLCIGLLLVCFDIKLPFFLDKTLKYLGDTVVGLSTLYIGMMIGTIRHEALFIDKDILAVVLGRFIICPLLILFLTWLLPIDPLMRNVFIIQSSLPVMVNAAILSAYYKADTLYATILVSITTLLSLITIPLYMALIILFLS